MKYRIRELYAEHDGMAGSPMITADLHDNLEYANLSRPRVARLMRSMGLKCRTVKKFITTTNSKHNKPVSPNILDRNFTVGSPNKAWVSDITYLKEGREFVQSMSRQGNCWGNAVAEFLFHTIKTGFIHHRRFQTLIERK